MNTLHWGTGCLLLCCVFEVALGEIYRCPDSTGAYVFTDQPCSAGDRQEDGAWVNIEEERRRERERRQMEAEREARRLAAEREEAERMARERANASVAPPRNSLAQKPKTDTLSVSFDECLARKAQVIASLGVNPRDIIPIVNTAIMTMDRICTVDGSVLITCSKLDRKMAVTKSSAHHDVGCR